MQHLNKNECRKAQLAIQDTLSVVNGKWKLVIISVLMHGKRRFKELSREVDISPRVLSKELQELGLNQLVTRTVCDTRPVTVEYAVTPYCKTLEEVIDAMNRWGLQHRQQMMGRKEAV